MFDPTRSFGEADRLGGNSKEKNDSGNYSVYAVRTQWGQTEQYARLARQRTELDKFVGESGVGTDFDIYRDQGGYNSTVSVNQPIRKKFTSEE